MKKYTITICGIDRTIHYLKEIIDDFDNDKITQDSIKKDIDYLISTFDGVKVSSLEEYFTLLERLNDIIEDGVKIYNNGLLIYLE